MRYDLLETAYNRQAAVAYADYWAYRRNPRYYSFDDIGGDCTNFVSQCIYAGSGVMNFTPTYGWYYISLSDRAPAWSGVIYLYRFLTENQGPGPFGRGLSAGELAQAEVGDIIQLNLGGEDYGHTAIVVTPGDSPEEIRVAAHDNNANCRPLSTYAYTAVRGIHIEGVRHLSPEQAETGVFPS